MFDGVTNASVASDIAWYLAELRTLKKEKP